MYYSKTSDNSATKIVKNGSDDDSSVITIDQYKISTNDAEAEAEEKVEEKKGKTVCVCLTAIVVLMLVGIASWLVYEQFLNVPFEKPEPLISTRLNRWDEIVEIDLQNL